MDYLVAAFMLFGAAFALVAALGTLRLPDLYCRMHAATKAGSFGASLLLIAACLHFQDGRVVLQSLMIIGFFYFTAPIAAHMLGRVGYHRGVRVWQATGQALKAPPARDSAQPQG